MRHRGTIALLRRIGYARAISKQQGFAEQVEALQAAGCERIYRETIITTRARRLPAFERAVASLKPGDVLTVAGLHYVAQSLEQLVDMMVDVSKRGVLFESLGEPWANTSDTNRGRLVIETFQGIAEFERKILHQRTDEGRRIARLKGVRFGRKRKLTGEQRAAVLRMLAEGLPVARIAREMKVHRATIYRIRDTNMLQGIFLCAAGSLAGWTLLRLFA